MMTQHKMGLLGLHNLVHQADIRFCFCDSREGEKKIARKGEATACEEKHNVKQ